MAHVKTDVTGGYGFDAWRDEPADDALRAPHHSACAWSERASCTFAEAGAESLPTASTHAGPER
jgi:hypothetical protein